jgi:hypothetical protein
LLQEARNKIPIPEPSELLTLPTSVQNLTTVIIEAC